MIASHTEISAEDKVCGISKGMVVKFTVSWRKAIKRTDKHGL